MTRRQYPVRVVSTDPTFPVQESYLYAVFEGWDGELRWGMADPKVLTSPRDGTEVALDRCGYMAATRVTPDEAMAITGLTHPMAAMDKLRDLLHNEWSST